MLDDPLSLTFSALADPTRRAILAQLSLGEFSVNRLAEPFAISKPGISKHLKVLEKAGLIARGRDAQFRPCRIETGRLEEVDQWLGSYRRLWLGHVDRLENFLDTLTSRETRHDRRP